MKNPNPELNPQLQIAGAVAPASMKKCTLGKRECFNVKIAGDTLEFHQTLDPKGSPPIFVRIVSAPPAATDHGTQIAMLVADEDGTYYSVEWLRDERDRGIKPFHESAHRACVVVQLSPREAMQWLIGEFVTDTDRHMLAELRRALETPEFEFMPLVARGHRKTRSRPRPAPAPGPFAVQLEMATAFVECVRRLDTDPSIVHLSQACRAASALHQSIHAPENFKTAGAL